MEEPRYVYPPSPLNTIQSPDYPATPRSSCHYNFNLARSLCNLEWLRVHSLLVAIFLCSKVWSTFVNVELILAKGSRARELILPARWVLCVSVCVRVY